MRARRKEGDRDQYHHLGTREVHLESCGKTEPSQPQVHRDSREQFLASRNDYFLNLLTTQRHLGAEHAWNRRGPPQGQLTHTMPLSLLAFPSLQPSSCVCSLLSHPMSFPTQSSFLLFLFLLFLVQCFSRRGPQGFGQNVGSQITSIPKQLCPSS